MYTVDSHREKDTSVYFEKTTVACLGKQKRVMLRAESKEIYGRVKRNNELLICNFFQSKKNEKENKGKSLLPNIRVLL